jgi:hypothetical protein
MRKRKIKRYNGEEDSLVEDYASLGKRATKSSNDEYDEVGAISRGLKGVEAAKYGIASKAKQEAPEMSAAEEKDLSPSNFKQAFAEARKAGDKTFEFRGKKYTTEMAKSKADEDEVKAERRMTAIGDKWREDKKAREAAAVPKASASEMERRKKMEKEQALETVAPEMNLIGGPGLKALQKGAQALAAKEAVKQTVKKRVEPSFRPIKDITPGPEKVGMAPRRIGYEPPKLGMKKGGAVKTATASKRADGIAQRGKTRGRMV